MPTTIFTDGDVTISKAPDGHNHVKIEFPAQGSGQLARYVIDPPHSLETNGAILEAFGAYGRVLEIIGFQELSIRFADLVTSQMAAGGICSLNQNTRGTYYCTNTSCASVCSLHNSPIYCSCGDRVN
jgi:hypothetical protein